ncbi:hypothetical protein [Thermocatellispora tengchongensis]|uniref:hypothetical protein n=1 Tax=Thermocatellispora tengchongensis TaxID=1073253 RepID=UPI003634F519
MSEVPQPPPEMPEMPYRGEYTERARRARLGWFRATTGAALRSLDATSIDARSLPGNLENFVGCVEVPVGLAGPMLFAGEHARGHVTAPLATTEGALVASAARGARAITRAGGVVTRAVGQRMVRAPFFEFAGLGEAAEFAHRITGHHAELAAEAARVSAHSRLVELDPVQLGRTVHVRFVYETADAGGQNMTTAATWRACRWILDRLCVPPGPSPTLFGVEGNLSGDKKFSHLNMTAGRGIRVIAECVLDPDTLRAVLKTTPEAMDRFYRIGVVAAQHAGMPGFDIDAANVIAAMFVATGQDIASVYESGAAQFSVDPDGAGLRATLVLPNLVAGTVGGGTGLPHQRDYLEALGCRGDAGARRFAEIVCGFALALDLSTLAAVASGQFADAHERLGRPRRVAWATRADLGAPLLQPLLAASLDAPDLAVTGVTWPEEAAGPSIITDLTAQGERRKLLGVLPVRASWEAGGRKGTLDLVLKVKPLDQEVIIEAAKLASLCGGRLAEVYPAGATGPGSGTCTPASSPSTARPTRRCAACSPVRTACTRTRPESCTSWSWSGSART